jgi:TonB family protein
MEILKYVKYCLSLFEECTINGLGTFQFIDAPAEKDVNGNLIKKKYHLIAFKPNTSSKPRLVNIIAGKEGCTIEQATSATNLFSENINQQLRQNKEVWISEIGILKRENDRVILLSHKFLVKSFKIKPIPAHSVTPKQVALSVTGTSNTIFDDLISSTGTQITAPYYKEVNIIPATEKESKSFTEKVAVKSVAKTTSTGSISPVFAGAGSGFAHDDQKTVQPEALSINSSGLELYSLTTGKKILAFSKKYMVHIGIAIGLLIATIITINFYISERGSSVNANNYVAPIPANTDTEIVDGPENNRLSESTITKEKKSTAKENKAFLLTNKEKETLATDKLSSQKKNSPAAVTNDISGLTTAKNETNVVAIENNTPAAITTKETIEPANQTPVNPVTEKAETNVTANAAQSITINSEFPEGEKGVEKYIRNKVQYPERAMEEGISGSVKVSFIIDENGNVKNPVIVDGLGGGCNEEAIRVISKMPKWNAATKDGVKIASRKTIKITFKQASEKMPKP